MRDPEEYAARGRVALLSAKEREFMVELVRNEPTLFLNKIRERLYDHSGTLLGMSTIHKNLVQRLHIPLKKPDTVNIRKSLAAKYRVIEEMENMPAEFLVFTGELPRTCHMRLISVADIIVCVT
jgi:transposase